MRRACKSGKRRYHDEDEAKAALTRIRQRSPGEDVPVRAYPCRACSGWHITRRSELPPPARGKPLERRSRLRPVSEAKRAAKPSEAQVRGEVFLRDGFKCRIAPLVPDVACWGRLTYHHLRKASQGGEYTVENGLTACQLHNDWVEIEPIRAKELGLVL